MTPIDGSVKQNEWVELCTRAKREGIPLCICFRPFSMGYTMSTIFRYKSSDKAFIYPESNEIFRQDLPGDLGCGVKFPDKVSVGSAFVMSVELFCVDFHMMVAAVQNRRL